MLLNLHIRNLAVVEKLDLQLHGGLTVITGETGAGKSIVVDALGLVLGERADSSFVRHGTKSADIQAVFDINCSAQVKAWLDSHELATDENECILRRSISTEGRSKAFINGVQVPVSQLRELSDFLVDIHGQHEHQSLMKTHMQRQMLDRFAGHEALVDQVADSFKQWQKTLVQWQNLQQSAEERELQLALLTHQVEELDKVNLSEDEFSQLEQEHARLAHGSRLLQGGQQVVEMLDGESEVTVTALLSQTLTELESLSHYDDGISAILELVNGASININEATAQLRHYCDGLDLDPQRLQEVEERIGTIHSLSRKHRVAPDELPKTLQALQQQLQELQSSDERKEQLDQQVQSLQQQYRDLAGKLSRSRRKAAAKLSREISASMQELGMPGGRFAVEFEDYPPGQESAHGLEKVLFVVTANPGQPLKPLTKVASGGELSRISLSIQVITSNLATIPIMIFDEVDVGIGGGIAEVVGRKLRELSENRQVLSVTHLAQVAALGHHHFQVKKTVDGNNTRTQMVELDKEDRVEEIARMQGGIELTEQTRAHAREMLVNAAKASAKSTATKKLSKTS